MSGFSLGRYTSAALQAISELDTRKNLPVRIPTDPDARSNDIRTAIPKYPDKLTRRS